MAVDAMETLITHPNIDVFVLVAGGGDYTPLVQRLREFGKWVVGVGTEASASDRLVSVCSQYAYWGTLVAEVDPSARAAVEAAFDIAAVEHLLRAAMSQATRPEPTAGWLKEQDAQAASTPPSTSATTAARTSAPSSTAGHAWSRSQGHQA